ncbi:hypothetical protein BGZ63DRAFT_511027 [Mariannaea sp. PMI_226]|nr:hypothetical protein BGZ63DRAFT_511027 [Mariannaea sp. PMI_226]
MRYCVLCGVPITRGLHETWLKEFRVVWIEDDNWDDVKLSGVRLCDEYNDAVTGTVPINPFEHYSDHPDPDSMIDVALMTFNLKHILHPETIRYGSEPFWGWAFHSSCWSLFSINFTPNPRLLFHVCLSMPIGVSSILDWGHNYRGAAALYRAREIPILSSRFSNLASIPQDLRSDPFDIPGLMKAIKHSVRLQHDAFQSHLDPNSLSLGEDKFSFLSPELLQLIITFLPTPDVRSLRLASPVFAMLSLPEEFWASRFQPGNEFDYIPGVFQDPPESWRTLYFSLQVWARNSSSMANRRRVWGLAKCLQTMLYQMEGVRCNGSPLKTWFEPSITGEDYEDGEKLSWHTAARNINDPQEKFDRGSRVLRARALHFSQPLEVQSISVSFVYTGGGLFISGLLIVDGASQSHALGYLHKNQTTLKVPTAQRIQEWELALDISGIRAIAIIAEDGTRSSWAGEPGDLPKWRLATASGIFAIKAEFDALKLATSSYHSLQTPPERNKWQNNCLWYPNIPPEQMLFNGSEGDQPPDSFDLPITTLFFGGFDGQDLSSLLEIIIWTFDICHVVGIEFIYANASQNRHLGHTGPFSSDHPAARGFDTSEGRRISMSIDGPGGEELRNIEVQEQNGWIVGLKIRTTFGQEFTSPQCPSTIGDVWTAVQPAGSKVVGLFSTYGHFLWNLGLISKA